MSRLWSPPQRRPEVAHARLGESLLAFTVLMAAAWALVALAYWLI